MKSMWSLFACCLLSVSLSGIVGCSGESADLPTEETPPPAGDLMEGMEVPPP